jgi:hypothetical protein
MSITLQAELPVSIFEPISGHDSNTEIREKVCFRLHNLLTFAERIVVRRADGSQIMASPSAFVPQVPTTLLVIQWPNGAFDDSWGFWELAKSYCGALTAELIKLTLPNGELVIKNRGVVPNLAA